jgi:hypothetical protein
MTFMVKNTDSPNRASIARGAERLSPPSAIAAAIRHPRQQ